jgi:H+/Cl- antiporter ClcA
VAAIFLWAVARGTHLLWVDVPAHFGIDAFGSWWLFAVPIVGGALVGVGQRFLGNYPISIDEALTTWKSGGHIDVVAVPKTFANSFVSLAFGGPVGFEAALTGILGGMATWISGRLNRVGQMVRQAWGAERVDALPHALRELPIWLTVISGLLAFHWWPFGGLDLGFRFASSSDTMGVSGGLLVFAFSAVVVVPVAWMIDVVRRAERATLFQRSPILIGMAGGVVFAAMAIPDSLVLFSGQQGIQQLPSTATGTLAYVMVAKWLALVIALLAGWRGGPVFPTFTAVAACAVLVASALGANPDFVMIAGIAAVSTVFLKGKVPLGFVLTLYAVPLSFAAVILVGCLGAATAFAITGSMGMLPSTGAADTGAPASTD